MALAARYRAGDDTTGLVHHSDRGTQYTSDAFQGWCAAHGVRQSMGRTGVSLG